MANHKQAIKRHKQSQVRAERNRYYLTTARTFIKRARLSLAEGDQAAATETVGHALKFVDQIAQKGVLHRNKAARLTSRLSRQLQALG